ncbi:unnamed protein product [Arabis nemorensis]|uniref:Uncharacterized protein n=1 Tax=Arabis nemorensis TaxID=586526 RepID=A0A565BSS5_9BRAS|nr:unnamed protein product [Arabis nemorensis]
MFSLLHLGKGTIEYNEDISKSGHICVSWNGDPRALVNSWIQLRIPLSLRDRDDEFLIFLVKNHIRPIHILESFSYRIK